MFGEDAGPLLQAMGKPPTAPGVVTIEQMGEAIGLLRKAADASKSSTSTPRAGVDAAYDADDRPGCDRRSAISLWQRAQPLIDLLERSQRAGQPVVWS